MFLCFWSAKGRGGLVLLEARFLMLAPPLPLSLPSCQMLLDDERDYALVIDGAALSFAVCNRAMLLGGARTV